MTKNGQACFYLVISRDGAVGVCLEQMKALTETSNVEPARGDLGFAGLAEDITGNTGLPAQVGRSVFATLGELVMTFSPSAASPNHITPDALWRGQPSITPNAFGCRALLDLVSRRRNGVRAKFASVRTRTLARRLPELTFSAR